PSKVEMTIKNIRGQGDKFVAQCEIQRYVKRDADKDGVAPGSLKFRMLPRNPKSIQISLDVIETKIRPILDRLYLESKRPLGATSLTAIQDQVLALDKVLTDWAE